MHSRRARFYAVFIFAVFLFTLIGLVIIISDKVFSYETDKTHPGVVTIAARVYNNYFKGNGLTEQEISWLQSGVVAEDTPNRWLNHFYDPIHNQGLKGKYLSAMEWATDNRKQAGYALGDKTWQRAIDDYRKGNRELAFKSLGHVLHLLADVSVPAHTRDDIHILGDSYEQFVGNNWPAISKNLFSAEISVDNLAAAFTELAYYANTNFYSDDTIISEKYSLPQMGDTYFIGGYFIQDLAGKTFKLLQARQSILANDLYIYQLDRAVLTDYVSFLLPKAVGYTAGVIDLFFREANSVERDYSLSPDRISWRGHLDQLSGTVIDKLEDIKKDIKFNDNYPQTIGALTGIESTTAELILAENYDLSLVTNGISYSDTTNTVLLEPASSDFSAPSQASSFVYSSGDSRQIPVIITNSTSDQINSTLSASIIAASLITASSTQDSGITGIPAVPVIPANSSANITDYSSSTCEQIVCLVSTSTLVSTDTFDLFIPDFFNISTRTLSILEDNASSTLVDDISTTTAEVQLSRLVVINEIAWAGTNQEYPNDEWIELRNNSSSSIDISAWKIFADDKELKITKYNNQIIAPFGYYLLERSDDDTIKQIAADAIFSGGLKNSGVKIELLNAVDEKVDQVDCAAGWFAGDDVKYRSMERIDSLQSGDNSNNWQSNQGIREDGRSYNGAPIYGSPRRSNFGFIALNYRQEDDSVALTKDNNPYVLQYYEIPAGKTLRIEPGVVVKSYYTNSYINIQGRLEIAGTSADKVVFTSGRDHSFNSASLDKTVGEWGESEPQAKDWQGFWFQASSSGWLDNLDMRYAGAGFQTANYLPPIASQSIRAEGSVLGINNSTFSHHGDEALYLKNSSSTLVDSVFLNGVIAIKAENSSLILSDLEFIEFGNGQGPMHIDGTWPKFSDLKFSSSTKNVIKFGQVEIKNQQVDLKPDISYLLANLLVDSSSTLNIAAGTEIDLSAYGTITINGKLNVLGTADQPVFIGKSVGWGYLLFNNSSSTLEHAHIYGGGGLAPEQDAAVVARDANLTVVGSRIWNSRAPGAGIKSVNSVLEIRDSDIGLDSKWPDPAWAGMSYTTGIKMIGGKLYLDDVGFTNLNYGVFKANYDGEPPLITLDNMLDSNYVNVCRPFAW